MIFLISLSFLVPWTGELSVSLSTKLQSSLRWPLSMTFSLTVNNFSSGW
ncbi:hypothetical protein GcM1_c1622o21 [Golovinomyces cichoracearum]|uniref:Uncharacterized protein n=1 Tax=Golovinomyces cichoracearum TaxID=62708 RepID=A0A420IFQ2_9PEZI|nr:hypothetical protein GcM1_c1622o21 [Golovinomyces cichoracearum]